MPATFDKLGISFQYPENWTLDDADIHRGRMSVTVYSPGGGFWTVARDTDRPDPARLAKTALEAMQQEYAGVESEEARETVAGYDLIGYDLAFFYLDLVNTAAVRSFRIEDDAYTIFFQAEDHEFKQIQRVFEAMTASLLQAIGKGERPD